MTEQEWLTSTDPAEMLRRLENWVTPVPASSGDYPVGYTHRRADCHTERKLRLFAIACCRAVWDGQICDACEGTGLHKDTTGQGHNCLHCGNGYTPGSGRIGGLTDPRSRRAVEVAERFADGMATEEEREAAWREVSHWEHASACLEETMRPTFFTAEGVPYGLIGAIKAALLRDIFGNPWRKSTLCGEKHTALVDDVPYVGYGADECIKCQAILRWNDATVPRIAQHIYDNRAWGDMPILADALLDAGCDDEDILQHCRGMERCYKCGGTGERDLPDPASGRTTGEWYGPCNCKDGWHPLRGPHVRGCWVIDLLLGKQ